MKILVTGAQGMLGRDAVQILQHSHQIMAVDLEEMDITDLSAVRRAVGEFSPEIILNAAAYTQVDRCESEEDEAFRINAIGPENLARAASETGGKLFHISTDYVFAGSRTLPHPYCEHDLPDPKTAYGRTKLEGERRIRVVSQKHVIVRTAWLYGFHGNNFLKTMLRLALRHPERQLTVVDDQFGCPTWSETLVYQLKALIHTPNASGVYHGVGRGFCSWYQLARHFLDAMSVPHSIKPCSTEAYPTPAKRPQNAILKNERLIEAGMLKMRNWEADVEAFVARYRDELIRESVPATT